MKVVMLKEGMERTGEYINRLCTAKENGLIDIDAYIPTATDILLELIKKAKKAIATANGYVIVQGIMFIKGQDYKLEQDGIDAKINELRRLKDRYIIPNVVTSFEDGSMNDYGRMETIINNRIGQLLNEEANDNSYIYDGKLTKI